MAPAFLFLIVLLLAVRTFLFQPFNIPSVSMSPSVNRGDYLIVSKALHRDTNPGRGDIIVFHVPAMKADYIKRVVGLPGDRVQMKRGVLFINNEPVRQHRVSDFLGACDSGTCPIPQYEELLPGGRTDHILEQEPHGPMDDTDVFVVPANSYFVLGDNRGNSDDSRGDLGYISHNDIIGRPVIRYRQNGRLVWQSVD